jgi:hypothetical protein
LTSITQYLHDRLLAQGSSLFKLVEIMMANVDSQVIQAMSAISSWAECSKANDRAINRLTTPLK